MTDPGETEFGGGPGIVQPAKLDGRVRDADRFTAEEERDAVIASNPMSVDAPDPGRIGKTASYNPTGVLLGE